VAHPSIGIHRAGRGLSAAQDRRPRDMGRPRKPSRPPRDEVRALRRRIAELERTTTAQTVGEMDRLLKSMASAFCVWQMEFGPNDELRDIHFAYFNDAYERIVGFPLSRVQDKGVHEVWPETEQGWYDVYRDVALTGVPQAFEMFHAPTNGLYACKAYRPCDSRDRVCVVFDDITARRKTEAELAAGELRYRRLVQHSSDVILVVDAHAVLKSVGGPVERIMGYTPEELVGTSGFDWVHPDDRDRVRAILTDAVQQSGSVRTSEYRVRHKSGAWVAAEAIDSNLLDDPAVQGIVLNVRDISKRKEAEEKQRKLEEQLQQAMKMEAVGRLAGGIAHDFNNLLTTIAGNVELARLDLAPTHPLAQNLDDAAEAVVRAATLTHQLLAFSRREIIEPRVLDLNELVDNLQKMLGHLLGEDVSLQARLAKGLGAVRVDPGQFEQVLVNLAVNARDAMPDGGSLLIETANVDLDEAYAASHAGVLAGPYVRLAVSDTGCGMTDEVRQRVFEPFFTTKPTGRGTGLGLATIFGVVKQAGGSVEVYSEVGLGTTFKIYLPIVEEKPEPLSARRPSAAIAGGTETVLLVEDDAGVRNLAILFLRRLGYNVMHAPSGEEALTLASSHSGQIDVLLTDVVMPGMNGRELADRLRTTHPEVSVLFTSGYTENVIVHHGVLENSLDFIGKPYSLEGLAAKIRAVLEAR
jgi:two-component system, cell cycle sensor histidine kinase and response regulator CckA